MAQRHCLACRTFLVCLWRSAVQVLTCNTTAVQFVSRQGGRSSPWVRREAVQLWCSHCTSFAPSRSQSTWTGHASRWALDKWPVKNSVLQNIFCQWEVPGIELFAVDQISVCQSFQSRPDFLTGIGLSSLATFSDIYLFPLPITRWALRTPKQNLGMITPSAARCFQYVDLRKFSSKNNNKKINLILCWREHAKHKTPMDCTS